MTLQNPANYNLLLSPPSKVMVRFRLTTGKIAGGFPKSFITFWAGWLVEVNEEDRMNLH